MTGFELQTSGIRSDRSTNWATTTAPSPPLFKTISNLMQLELSRTLFNRAYTIRYFKRWLELSVLPVHLFYLKAILRDNWVNLENSTNFNVPASSTTHD